MIKYLYSLILICLIIPLGLGQGEEISYREVNFRLSELRSELGNRLLDAHEYVRPLPPIRYKVDLPANARYEMDTIWIGKIQHDFNTTDDTLSILRHEYFHFLIEGKYEYRRDSTGQIVQWNTGETYTYLPDKKEILRELSYFEKNVLPTYGNISTEEKQAHVEKLHADLAKPRELLFIYAPSNLAKEEIEAYEAQLSGEDKGLYKLSEIGRASIERKLRQMRATFLRRLTYEEKMELNPNGSKK